MKRRQFLGRSACLSLLVLLAPQQSLAQDFPSRPIQVVVPFAAGGVADVLARLLATKSQEQLGQPMVILNRVGAGGIVGMDSVAKSKPDGYTLAIGTIGSLAIAAAINPNLPYDSVKDFTPISRLTTQAAVLLARPNGRFDSLEKLVEYAKQNPRKLNYGTGGIGTVGHMVAELFSRAAGIEMVHVPYKGDAPAVTAVMSGEADLAFVIYTSAAGQIKAGQVLPIAVPSPERLKELPNVPNLVEKGYASGVGVGWIGVSGPAGMPKAIVDRLSAYFQAMMAAPDIRSRMEQLGLAAAPADSAEFGKFVGAEVDKYRDVARKANIKAE